MTGRRVGPYELIEVLGKGAMGVVWRARHVGLGVEHALKLVPQASLDPDAAVRFQREAEAMAALPPHPNLVALHAAGSDGRTWWLAMDLVEGESLEARLRTGPIAPEQAARWIRDAARGLAELHARGLAHRDVKPGNLLVGASGVARLADLGLVKAKAEQARLTRTGEVVGTPLFLPPEALGGSQQCGPPGDVWALGLSLFQLLTGRTAVAPGHLTTVMLAVAEGRLEPLLDAPPGLAAVYERCRQADPARRPGAGEVADALEAWLADPTGSAGARRRWPAAAGLASLALLLGAALVATTRGAGGSAADPVATVTSAPIATEPAPPPLDRSEASSHLARARALVRGEPRQAVRAALSAWLEVRNAEDAEAARLREEAVVTLRRGLLRHAGGLLHRHELPERDGQVRDLAFGPGARQLLAACYGVEGVSPGRLRRWSLPTWREEPAPSPASAEPVRACAFSPDGEWVAVGYGPRLERWRLGAGEPTRIGDPLILPGTARAFLVSEGGDLAAMCDGPAFVIRPREGALVTVLLGKNERVRGASLDPTGRFLAVASSAGVHLWPMQGGEARQLDLVSALGLAFSGDGERLIAAGAKLRAWRVEDGAQVGPETPLDPVLACIGLSARGVLATGHETASQGPKLRLWDLAEGGPVERPPLPVVHLSGVNVCAFSRDGALLATADDAGVVALWGVEEEALDPAFLPPIALEPDPEQAVRDALRR